MSIIHQIAYMLIQYETLKKVIVHQIHTKGIESIIFEKFQ